MRFHFISWTSRDRWVSQTIQPLSFNPTFPSIDTFHRTAIFRWREGLSMVNSLWFQIKPTMVRVFSNSKKSLADTCHCQVKFSVPINKGFLKVKWEWDYFSDCLNSSWVWTPLRMNGTFWKLCKRDLNQFLWVWKVPRQQLIVTK